MGDNVKFTSNITVYAHWSPIEYNVKFDKNGGSGTDMANQSFVYDTAQNLTVNTYTNGTKVFAGWNTVKAGSGTSYSDGAEVKNLTTENNKTITLYAQWADPATYTVAFNGNGNTGGSMNSQTVNCGSTTTALTQNGFTRTGYTFAGWDTSSAGTTVVYSDQYVITSDLASKDGTFNLYAVWTANSYEVAFSFNSTDTNTGTSMSNQSFTYGTAQNLTANTFARTGYTFSGWATTAEGSKAYDDEASVNNLTSTDDDTFNLYAVWTANSYEVAFDFNSTDTNTGTSMSNQSFTYGTAQNLSANTFARTGYTFSGWATTAEGSKAYDDAASVSNLTSTNGGTYTLYAVWTANSYEVAFSFNSTDTNTGTSMSNQSFTYGTAQTLTANTFARTGYTFSGWAITAEGSKAYDDEASVNNLTSTANDTFNLYAVWTANTYDVTLDYDDGKGAVSDPFSVTYGQNIADQNVPGRNGYDFGGYYTQKNGQGVKYIGSDGKGCKAYDIADDSTLYAYWTAGAYTVVYNLNSNATNNVTGTVPTDTANYFITEGSNEITAATSVSFTTQQGDYRFDGWALSASADKSGVVADYTITGEEESRTVTFYAVWTYAPYTVTYSTTGTDSGTAPTDSAHYASGETATVLGNTGSLTRTGYHFTGWKAGATVYSADDSYTGITANVEFTPEFEANSYEVKFNANGGSGDAMPNQDFVYDATAKALSTNTYTKTGYQFAGWDTDSSADTVVYTDGQSVSNLTSTDDDTFNLYAVWTANSYEVKFNANGGSGDAMPNQDFVYDDTAKALSTNTYTKTGYQFSGWDTDSSADSVVYTDGQSVSNLTSTDDDTFNLYAVWTANSYKVKFNANGGSGTSMTDQDFVYDATAKALSTNTYTKTGYQFSGWDTDSSADSVVYTDGQSVSNLTSTANDTFNLYAVWTANSYEVAFSFNSTDTNTGASMSNQSFTYDAAQNLSANTFARTGYTFAGWATTAEGSKAYDDEASVSNLTSTNGGTYTLYAVWTANTYKVKFNINTEDTNTSGMMFDQDFTYNDTAKSLTANSYSRTGYHFAGWATAAEGSKVYDNEASVRNLTSTANDTFNLYALWTANTYKVKFNADTADINLVGSMNDEEFTYDVAKNLTANTLARTGYTFAGWATVSGGVKVYDNAASVSNLTPTDGGTYNLYAVWTPIKYNIVFNANLGEYTGSTESKVNVNYDAKVELTQNGFVGANGEVFVGWNTKADGTGSSFGDKLDVMNLTSVNGASVTLYAQWKQADKYSVSGYVYTDLRDKGDTDGPAGAVVKLKKLGGSTEYVGIADREPTAAKTTADKVYYAYRFTNLEPGTYQLTAIRTFTDGKTKTMTMEIVITEGDMNEQNILLNNSRISSLAVPSASLPTVIDDIQQVAEQRKKDFYNTSDSYELKMYIENVTSAQNADIVKTDAFVDTEFGADYETVYLNIYMNESHDGSAPSSVTDSGTLVKNTVAFDFSTLAAGSTVHVVRVHNGGAPEEIGTTPNAAGEYIVLNQTEGTIEIYAKLYSTYGIVCKRTAPAPVVIRTNPNTGVVMSEAVEITAPTAETTVDLPRKREEIGR